MWSDNGCFHDKICLTRVLKQSLTYTILWTLFGKNGLFELPKIHKWCKNNRLWFPATDCITCLKSIAYKKYPPYWPIQTEMGGKGCKKTGGSATRLRQDRLTARLSSSYFYSTFHCACLSKPRSLHWISKSVWHASCLQYGMCPGKVKQEEGKRHTCMQ